MHLIAPTPSFGFVSITYFRELLLLFLLYLYSGPGHGIQLKSGRLVIQGYMVVMDDSGLKSKFQNAFAYLKIIKQRFIQGVQEKTKQNNFTLITTLNFRSLLNIYVQEKTNNFTLIPPQV